MFETCCMNKAPFDLPGKSDHRHLTFVDTVTVSLKEYSAAVPSSTKCMLCNGFGFVALLFSISDLFTCKVDFTGNFANIQITDKKTLISFQTGL